MWFRETSGKGYILGIVFLILVGIGLGPAQGMAREEMEVGEGIVQGDPGDGLENCAFSGDPGDGMDLPCVSNASEPKDRFDLPIVGLFGDPEDGKDGMIGDPGDGLGKVDLHGDPGDVVLVCKVTALMGRLWLP